MYVRWLRLSTGLVLATYIILHLLNLALGLLSIGAMEGFRKAVTEIWYHPVGGILLYFSFLTHFNAIIRGVIDLRDIIYFASLIAAWLVACGIVVDMKKAG